MIFSLRFSRDLEFFIMTLMSPVFVPTNIDMSSHGPIYIEDHGLALAYPVA